MRYAERIYDEAARETLFSTNKEHARAKREARALLSADKIRIPPN